MRKILLIFLIALNSYCGFSQYVNFKQFTTDNNLGQQFVYSIVQNKNGFLIVGTGNGLSFYGGEDKFKNYTAKNGLSDNFVTSTFEDDRNITWIGHFQNGLSYYTNNHFGRVTNTMLATVKVNRIVGDDKKNVFALSSGLGIVQIVDTLSEKKLEINEEIVYDAYINDNRYYLATPDGLRLYNFRDQKFVQAELPPVFSSGLCSRIVHSATERNEYFCAIADVGIVWFKVSRDNIHIIRIFSPKELKSNAAIKDFVLDKSNNIWVSCFDDGIRKINCKGGNLHYYLNTSVINTSNGLPSNHIECLFMDNQKNIWLGTYGEGLLQYVNEIFIEYRIEEGETYLSLTADRKDNIIIVTSKGLYKTTDSTGTQNLTPLIINADERKLEYVAFVNDTLFVTGEKKNSIFIYDIKTEKIKAEFIFNKTPNTSVNHIFGKGHLLYVSTTQGLYVLTTTLRFVNYFNHENGLLHDFVYSSYHDSQNRLWLASHGTKPYWLDVKTGKITYFNDIQGMIAFNINGYVEDSRQNIWIAADGDGLFKYDSKKFTKFSSNEALLSNYCYGINKDLKNNIWVGHRNGLTKISPEEKFTTFSGNTQVKNIKMVENGIVKDQAGYLWFIGDKAIFKHAIQNEAPNTVPPSIVYEATYINNDTTTSTFIDLPYDNDKYSVKFKVACISLTDPDKVEISYMLEGQDPEWISASRSNFNPIYSALSSGTYRFKVMARNEDGFSSEETILVTIKVDKPMWLKWWFILCCVVLLVLLIILFIRYRTNQLIKNKKVLEQKIHEQTIEIRGEKEYISKINKELNLVYKDLKDSINYAKNIQTSILPHFDQLKNKLRIYNYLNAKDVVGGDFYGFYELPNGSQIVFLVDCTGHGVPGGFLTVIAKALLDKIILQMKVRDCNEIIHNLNIEFRLFFGSDSQRQNIKFEGLVISLCLIDYKAKVMKVCAAGTSVYYTQNEEIVRFRGSRDSVGYEERMQDLEILELPIQRGTRVYMFSDGVQDQFGGPFYKRYSTKRLLGSIERAKHLVLEEQGENVIKDWLDWKGSESQIDDVAFIALEVV
jgi:ligand-binding sensor domain-containing protein/serine phosphatase RsbU (regulator of sigma subunit)